MRISTLFDGTPDGQLVVLSEDGQRSRRCVALNLQAALDGLGFDHVPEPESGYDVERAMAAMPRSFQFLDGSAYVNHVDLVRRSRGAEMPERFWTDPLMYQGCSLFLNPSEDIVGDEAWGLDFEAEIAIITNQVPRGVDPTNALNFIAFVVERLNIRESEFIKFVLNTFFFAHSH